MSGRRRRLALAVAVAVAVPVASAGGPLLGTAVAGSSPQQSVTLVLTPPDRPALRALALTGRRAGNSSADDRLSRAEAVHRLEPQPAAGRDVSARVRSLGLTVTTTSAWSVTASGPADLVRRTFGSARAQSSGPWARSLPGRPAGLARLVTTVVGGDETRPAKRPLELTLPPAAAAPLTTAPAAVAQAAVAQAAVAPDGGWRGPDLRALYGLSTDGTAPTGHGGQTIATLQFSGWNSADLSTWAAGRGLPDPRRNGQYQEVAVSAAPGGEDGMGGDVEVALDQQVLLGVAPHARQRAYFAANTDAGGLAALHRIAADATDAAAGFHDLTTLSTSWGICEAYEPADVLLAEEDALEAIVAAGVTVVAATGDHGAFDCSGAPSRPGVDFPASSPVVLAVGGTATDGGATVGWSSSGGGPSAVFARPAYQPAGDTHRTVPDLSLVADPANGFGVYSSTMGGWASVGGTSLSAPAFAGMLTAASAAAGVRWGIGDVHSALYAPVPAGAASPLVDVTQGFNGRYPAGPGYDEVTGLGVPAWDALAPLLLDGPVVRPLAPWSGARQVPVAVDLPGGASAVLWWSGPALPTCSSATTTGSDTVPVTVDAGGDGWRTLWVQALMSDGRCLRSRAPVLVDRTPPALLPLLSLAPGTAPALRIGWSVTDPAPGSGPQSVAVSVVDHASGAHVLDASAAAGSSLTVPTLDGRRYDVTLTATDRAGNIARAVTATWTAPVDDRLLVRRGAWATTVGAGALDATLSSSGSRDATATWSGTFSHLAVVVAAAPAAGLLDVWVDGARARILDTSGVAGQRRVLDVGAFPAGPHVVTLRPLGEGRGGTLVAVDALAPSG